MLLETTEQKKNPALSGVLFSSFAMAFAGLGDALLYPVLPVYGEQLGISTLWIGVLLSVNRFVRIPGNTIVAWLVSKKGYRQTMIIASTTAVISTISYGLSLGIYWFFIARLMWGLSYSSLRVSSLSYAAQPSARQNLMFGLNAGIKTLGAVLALFLGPILINWLDVPLTFMILGGISIIAIVLSYNLPEIQFEKTKTTFRKTLKITPISLITFLTSFGVDGILVVIISKLLSIENTEKLIVVVGFYLLFRRISSSFMSILSGYLSDLIGVQKVFGFSLALAITGMMLIAFGFTPTGIIIAFLFNSFIVAMLPAAALSISKENKLETLTSITTWWDIGAALGTLVGLNLLQLMGSNILFVVLSVLLILAFTNFLIKSASIH